jgi:hypothetical protein
VWWWRGDGKEREREGEYEISRKAMRGRTQEGESDAYKGAVSQQLDIVLLADICHAVERAGIDQGELCNGKG